MWDYVKIAQYIAAVSCSLNAPWYSTPTHAPCHTPRHAPPMQQPMHWPMYGSTCPSTKSPIPPQHQNTHLKYMILLLLLVAFSGPNLPRVEKQALHLFNNLLFVAACLLCISTSERVLRTPFACRNQFLKELFAWFFALFYTKKYIHFMIKKYVLKGGLPA